MVNEQYGKQVIETLAQIYSQLFIKPGPDSEEVYRDVVGNGKIVEDGDLSHFTCSENDSLSYVETPAGDVCVITLNEREDFETFIRIMAKKCRMDDIPANQGAYILDGVINWRKIYAHQAEFLAQSYKEGTTEPDWDAEFERFTSDRNNYKDVLIVLSAGPYSNIPASKLGFEEEAWLDHSYIIRKYHECTHFICRKKYPDKIDAIWDELVADAVGIYAAFGEYDADMEKVFLGIGDDGYIGGRLENYVNDNSVVVRAAGLLPESELVGEAEKKERLDKLSYKINDMLEEITNIARDNTGIPPFEFALLLEEQYDRLT